MPAGCWPAPDTGRTNPKEQDKRDDKTETKSRAGADLSAAAGSAAEVRQALARLVTDISEKLQAQEERLNMLDRKSIVSRRPALSTAAEQEAPHQKAFESYVRCGDEGGLRGLVLESKALSTTIGVGRRLPRRSADLGDDPVGPAELGLDPARSRTS